MVETLERVSEYKISTVNDSRFVSAKEIAGALREKELSMCDPDSCGIDYADCGPKVNDFCRFIDFA